MRIGPLGIRAFVDEDSPGGKHEEAKATLVL